MTGFVEQLRASVDGDVLADPTARALYSTDASNYRHVPLVVVRPRSPAAVVSAVQVAVAFDVPITNRGAGTSIAGNSAGSGLVIDFARYLDRVVSIDPVERVAVVQPGVVLDRLNDAARSHGLLFGPDPSTHSRCTIGGMIGNDACGSHSVAWGKTSDNVVALDVLLPDGRRFDTRTPPALDLPDVDPAWFPSLDRRVSGYRLDALPDLARALVGTEGTCVTVLGASLRLVEAPERRVLAVLGFDGPYDAADRAAEVRQLDVLAVEGINASLADAAGSRALLPRGVSWLFVETADEAVARLAASLAPHSVVVTDPARQRALWRVREDGAGLATRMADGGEAWAGWEDAAVPPEKLGAYLREFDALLTGHGRRGVTYGHFGEGCLHVRIDFDLRAGYRSFLEDAADLVVAHGGSLSGEHGDGQARSELLPRMYPPAAMRAFGRFKAAFDPENRMNPGRIVDPLPLDEDLRVVIAPPTIPTRAKLALHADRGDLAAATRRCVGVGKCLNTSGGVMCPSYRVTREEKHSTRGRARLLFEMLNGQVVRDGWRSAEVRDALDLCLGCKGCKRDCPVDVDMATYKAEFLHHHYRRRVRPLSHYSMGWLPLWLRLRLVNRVTSRFGRFAGVTAERPLPTPASRTFQRTFTGGGAGDRVLLFPDTFTNYFEPVVGEDAAAVLSAAGQGVEVPRAAVCCGLTWFSTGQLGMARRVIRRTARELRPWTRAGVPVVGLEPSCTAFLRSDALEVAGDDQDVVRLAESVRTFAEHVSPLLEPLPVNGSAVVQPHCHQYAETGLGADRELLERVGVTASVLEGCCGLAGNFGFEKGHYDVSMAVAEQALLPAVRAASPDTAVVADGFSCRTQVRQGSSAEPVHTATLVARSLGVGPSGSAR
ncbi:FAD/FMN-containing dehydrogenase/Fe-S oxidoreductase [Saccharothrix tamanrassetensis]|uniref:FAD/FMN-containing dehydrogenase/Fe-S oxidoreductase n=1 Tax=Saccharothrix tamanrassetensis TaxID=1051531 RepID=A0A841CDR0_9PSEU|nr:FAD-linked oxidase C-terminal domain-containing protein [Saccharothrix tamanrassetensis]MBB5954165.1 FAD/FMN-containing dehydrogenase/Fe-S oxidoreductase [Saccharothrix tamanrassetensis]